MIYLSQQITDDTIASIVKQALEIANNTASDDQAKAEVFALMTEFENVPLNAEGAADLLAEVLDGVDIYLQQQGFFVYQSADAFVIAEDTQPQEGDWITEDFFDFIPHSPEDPDKYINMAVYSTPDNWRQDLQDAMQEAQFFISRLWFLGDDDMFTLIQNWQLTKKM
jgi:hypothetical protein